MSDKDTPALSIVIPVFNEQDSIARLVEEIHTVLRETEHTYEVIIVDDGSADDTKETALRLSEDSENVNVISLARNYGQSMALQAGFDAARGDHVISMDGDLQNDPTDILRLIDAQAATGADFVCGWRDIRKDGWLRVKASAVANLLISKLFRLDIHDVGCTLRIYRREILDRVQLIGDSHRLLPAYLVHEGATTTEIKVNHRPREHGVSKYGFERIISVILDTFLIFFLIRYADRPLHFFGRLGLFLMVPGLSFIAYLTIQKILFAEQISGRPLLLIGIFLALFGLNLLSLGVFGEIQRRFNLPYKKKNYYVRQ